jgi:YYY domain-containing protein
VTAVQGAFVAAFAELIALPFTISFDQISSNINLAINHTPLNQLIILWGLPICMVIAFLCFLISDFCKNRNTELNMEQRKQSPIFQHLFHSVSSSDLFIIIIGLCAIGLILIPEVIFVQDIYSGDYKRANTMFKLTYQAFIMFGICFGYIFLRLICFGTTRRQKKVAVTGIVLFTLSVCYIQNAVNAWYGNIFDASGYEGIDATVNLAENMPDDTLAIAWLNANVTGTPVVLEAPGDSYTNYERVSVMTGLPTVLGWRTHEWLWKGDTSLLDARAEDIMLIYTSDDETKVKELLEKYDVSYLYVGKLELDKYTEINHDLLKSLGETVFLSAADETKDYETYIIKVVY